MKKHFLPQTLSFFIIILLVIIILISNVYAVEISNEEAFENYNLKLSDIQIIETNDINYLKELISECSYQMSNAHQTAEFLRKMHYSEDNIMIRIMQHDWCMYKHLYDIYVQRLNNIKATQIITSEQMNQYPVASTVWKILKEYGYNDYICSGIIGNMMTECGGNTLNLNYQAYGSSGYYYGLCQWNKTNYSTVFDKGVEEQVRFLLSNIRYELNTYGFLYQSNFDYDSFLNLKNEQDAAIAFAACYERCSEYSYSMRQSNASIAYNYFVK